MVHSRPEIAAKFKAVNVASIYGAGDYLPGMRLNEPAQPIRNATLARQAATQCRHIQARKSVMP